MERYVGQHPGARRADATPEWTSYELPATGAIPPPAIAGTIAARSHRSPRRTTQPDIRAILDGDLDTRWHTPQQAGGETIVADLGQRAAGQRGRAVPGSVSGAVSARAHGRGLARGRRLVSGLYWRHRARDIRRGASIPARGARHAARSSRSRPFRPAPADRERSPLRLDDRRAPDHSMSAPRQARAIALASLGYILLSIAYTWPLAIKLRTGVAHDLGDPLLNVWILWWSGTQAVPLTAPWWNAPIFYPAPGDSRVLGAPARTHPDRDAADLCSRTSRCSATTSP